MHFVRSNENERFMAQEKLYREKNEIKMLSSFIYAISHALDCLDNALEERNVSFKVSGRDTVYTSCSSKISSSSSERAKISSSKKVCFIVLNQSEGYQMKESPRSDPKKRGPQLETTRKRRSGRFLANRKMSLNFWGKILYILHVQKEA